MTSPAASIRIRPERRQDYPIVHQVIALAFGRENEARLVADLRRTSAFIPELSLVAVQKREILGHILFSPIAIQTNEGIAPALALAPLSVRPEYQKRGIGSRLVQEGLKRCRRLGHRVVVVIGHPAYYPRFGFTPARAKGLQAPFPVPDPVFMVLELVPGVLAGVNGLLQYPQPFDER